MTTKFRSSFTYMDQGPYEEIVANPLLGQAWLDANGVKVRKPKVARTGMTTRAERAAGAGGTCPYFGLDFMTDAGVHHLPNCGFDKDGNFAKKGHRSSAGKPGAGYEGHMEWVSATNPKTIAAAKKAAAKSAS